MATDKQSPVLILGGGAWGLSTALHLNEQGYTDITVLERAESIPSPYSAAFDLNKIVRAEYEDPFYTELALDAIEGWKTPLFGPYYHQTGYIVATTGSAPPKAIHHLEAALETIATHPVFAPEIRGLNGPDAFRKYAWQFSGPLTGFKGYFNRIAGYAHSSNTLRALWLHCASKGVKFILGQSAGTVRELLYEGEKSSRKCVGAITYDGKRHLATTTICALGSHGVELIPGLGHFTAARSWSVAHVQLTQEEADLLRGLPTVNVRDLGFFFEPDPQTNLFKLCPLGAGYTNTTSDGVSVPPNKALPPPQDFIPAEDERKLRKLLRETLPWMADRPFVEQRLCWFADTLDSEYCIDYVPNTNNSLVVLSGDSGHGFKMTPVFGKWVATLLADGKQKEQRWTWRDTDMRGTNWSEAVSWRIGQSRELKDLVAEHKRLTQARL